jgi:hypothetical protein
LPTAACEKPSIPCQTKRCLDVDNYPAASAFSKSAYKIYAVHRLKKYKSNSILAGWVAFPTYA